MASHTDDDILLNHFLPFLRYSDMHIPTMVFVDGENFAIRYKDLAKQRGIDMQPSSLYEPDVFVWSDILNTLCDDAGTLRKHYYTSVNEGRRREIEDRLKAAGIEAPYVFTRPKKDKGRHAKGVDIALAVDMLTHASRKNYALAILIAGDGDYVPLVKAVKAEGSRVYVWFFDESYGLSRDLRMSADYYAEISIVFPF